MTNNEFIRRARERWGGKYNYDKADLSNLVNRKVCVTCPVHGDFFVAPSDHIRKDRKATGCARCSGHMRYTNADVIRRAEEIYGTERYDFSSIDVEHRDSDGKVTVICRKHGQFRTSINNLLKKGRKNCCPMCSPTNHPYTTATFIEKAMEVHAGRYAYPGEYTGINKKIKIECPVHGMFEQYAKYHILGHGCPKCDPSCKSNTSIFIARARKVHGDFYNYDKVIYENSKTPVVITCPIHGDFKQTPNGHLTGMGCSCCVESKLEEAVRLRLIAEGIAFESYKHFEGLVGERNHPLSYDFYLPEYRTAIECQGIQHFSAVEFFGGDEAFQNCRKRDMRKWRYCNEHNIQLLYYSKELRPYHSKIYISLDDLISTIKQ